MKALILNAGRGSRMGELTAAQPKCMVQIAPDQTIVSRQLRMLAETGIREVVMLTGYQREKLTEYCLACDFPGKLTFVENPDYHTTNYIDSIYCARAYLDDDILLIHGDMVFENRVLDTLLAFEGSCMAVSSTLPPPEKDFKAVTEGGWIRKIGVECFASAVAAQPFYKLDRADWGVWLGEIVRLCEAGTRDCYAEEAFNRVSGQCRLAACDVGPWLCREIDTPEDLQSVSVRLHEVETRSVYMSFSADILHSGHLSIIKKAQRLGKLTIGALTDEAVASYKRFPLLPFSDRKAMLECIAGVERVVEQRSLSYRENLERYRPDIVVHGDDWVTGTLRPVRDEVQEILASYGGELVEFPYTRGEIYQEIDRRTRAELSLPDLRRARLKKTLAMKGFATALEAHSGITGLIVEKTIVYENGCARQFDAMWISSLCDSTAKGKPDIELVDMTSRFRTIDDIMEVTTKPIIFDGDTGGMTEHFVFTVRTLERMGVSMVIIEDKTGLKKNSLFGTEVIQQQDSIEHFCAKIAAGKRAQKTADFMICARIESLILERGLEDALARAAAFTAAGADAIMIHSRKKEPDEIFAFVRQFRKMDSVTPLVVIPTSFNSVTEEQFKALGVNIVIYANQLTRSGFPAMQQAAQSILSNHRAQECDRNCMPIKEIITLIPEEI